MKIKTKNLLWDIGFFGSLFAMWLATTTHDIYFELFFGFLIYLFSQEEKHDS